MPQKKQPPKGGYLHTLTNQLVRVSGGICICGGDWVAI
jgi:hypothetical protein